VSGETNAPGVATRRLGLAWLLLSAAVATHVADEALTGFLSVYNPTVLALRQSLGWWPMPTFTYEGWLSGLVVGIVILFLLSPLAFRNARGFRPFAYVFAVLMILNGVGHTAGTIAGRTFESIRFPRPMPGFYSSPFLIAAAIYVLVALRRSPAGGGRAHAA
jgi:hypothetical protein